MIALSKTFILFFLVRWRQKLRWSTKVFFQNNFLHLFGFFILNLLICFDISDFLFEIINEDVDEKWIYLFIASFPEFLNLGPDTCFGKLERLHDNRAILVNSHNCLDLVIWIPIFILIVIFLDHFNLFQGQVFLNDDGSNLIVCSFQISLNDEHHLIPLAHIGNVSVFREQGIW